MRNTIKTSLKDILKPIEPYLKQIDKDIKSNLTTGIPIMDESTAYIFQRGGKKIRASLAILGSGLIKNKIPDDITDLATSMETFHTAALVHDDIIDQSMIRRGNLTISEKKGDKIAVLVGDYMYTNALRLSMNENKIEFYREMIEVACEMILGELYQMEYSNIEKINKEHYFRIIEYKTAKFMGICSKIGGIKAEMTDEELDLLYNFGLNLGMAFQIIDDTLDYSNNKEIVGKDTGTDFIEGKITLPLLHLLEISNDKEKEKLSAYAANPDPEGWKYVRQKVIESESIEYCKDVAKEYNKKALNCLDYFPHTLYKDILHELTEFLISREY